MFKWMSAVTKEDRLRYEFIVGSIKGVAIIDKT